VEQDGLVIIWEKKIPEATLIILTGGMEKWPCRKWINLK